MNTDELDRRLDSIEGYIKEAISDINWNSPREAIDQLNGVLIEVEALRKLKVE